MNRPHVIDVLNRLLRILHRSLPAYLQETKAWAGGGTERARDVLGRVLADQQHYARLLADAVVERRGRIEAGQFPVEFTAINDLHLDFLLKRVIEHQRRDIKAVEQCTIDLAAEPQLQSLAEEILGNARGHLETLEEMMSDE